MPPPEPAADDLGLTLGQAVALGLMHGPAELLPVSSSAHVAVIPWLAGWKDGDPELRKTFEIALHAGTAAALIIALRHEIAEAAVGLDARRIALIALSFGPPAAAGLAFERVIERHLGGPATIAAGLTAGSLAMAFADHRSPQRRGHRSAGAADGLWLGIAQACALAPGVSRGGATLTAARLRGFRRLDSRELSRHVALPVIAGATLLKGVRLARRGFPRAAAVPLAAGTAASFVSTLVSARAVLARESARPLGLYAAYRLALAGAVIRRLRQNRSRA
jgi:undecaprenyl-diphosphatase